MMKMMRNGFNMFAIGLVLVCVVLGALGQVAMKGGMKQIPQIDSIYDLLNLKIIIDIFSNVYIVAGLTLYMVAAFLWLGALSTLDVSYMYPLLSLGYILTAIFAVFYLGETITISRWSGIFLVVIGCFLILRS
jgi:drug/metabolite transporter (DMT)-like permease